MWLLGFIFHEMTCGLLSVFLPLYVIYTLGGGLIDVGLMMALASFIAIPSSYFWGYLCDKTGRYKIYILFSFFSLAFLFFLLTLTETILVFILLYALVGVFHVAHEPPKNVLIAESRSRPEWERGFASYEALTGLGWLLGLLLGFVLSSYGFLNVSMLFLCSFLNLVALVTSTVLVRDPVLIFERRLVNIERSIGFVCQGCSLAYQASGGIDAADLTEESLTGDNFSVFCLGLVFFFLASSILFTPLPVFFSQKLSLSSNIVFAIFFLNSLGNLSGYILAGARSGHVEERALVKKTAILRGLLCLLLSFTIFSPSIYTLLLSGVVLIFIGIAYGVFHVSTISLSMELIPEGRAGLYNALIGLGAAVGCFVGSFLADCFGFVFLFVTSSLLFVLSFVAFKRSMKSVVSTVSYPLSLNESETT